MNLDEKRETKRIQESEVAPAQERWSALAQQPVLIEVNWESFAGQAEALRKFVKFLPDAEKALAHVCADEFGREAVQQKIKKITFEQVKDKGVLTDTAAIAEETLSFFWDWSRMYIDPARLTKRLSQQL